MSTETAPPTASAIADDEPQRRRWALFAERDRSLVLLAAVLSYAAAWVLGDWTRVPAEPGFDPSILGQPSAVVALFVTAVIVVVAAAVSRVVAGRRAEATVFGAAIALAALSYRGGSMTALLHDAASPAVFLRLIVEVVLLTALLLAAWWVLGRDKHERAAGLQAGTGAMALATATLVAAILVYVLVPVTDKLQAMGGVLSATLIGTWVAHSVFPVRSPVWYWLAGPVVGVVGYALAFANPGHYLVARTGHPLAHAIPLDYCGAGVAGALLGYWFATQWRIDELGGAAGSAIDA